MTEPPMPGRNQDPQPDPQPGRPDPHCGQQDARGPREGRPDLDDRQPERQAALRAAVHAHLRERRSLTLATSGPEGPWAAAVYFAADGLSLYFLSDPASRHCRDFAANPQVAAAVHEDVSSWQDIRGVQLSGRAEAVTTEPEARAGWTAYLAKFPFVSGLRTGDGFEILGAAVTAHLYKITPDRLFFLDNRRGFGSRRELDLTGGG